MTVLDDALAEARRLDHNWLGTEHLLLVFVQRPELLPQPVARLLPSIAAVRAALNSEINRAPAPDAKLLATLGIDLDDVRTTVRQTFGAEAIHRLAHRRVHQPWQPWRRPHRRCISLLAGHMGVAPRVKQALDHARRDSARRQQSLIDPAALLLGILEVHDALANHLLRDTGVEPDEIRTALHDAPH